MQLHISSPVIAPGRLKGRTSRSLVWTRLGAALAIAVLVSSGALAQTSDCTGFLEHSIMDGGTNGASAVFAADLDGDTYLDIITASANDDTIAWYKNDQAGGFTRQVIATDVDGASAVYATDIDGDGDMDVFAGSANDDSIILYENVSAGLAVAFVRLTITTNANRVQAISGADIDGDGDVDLLSASFTDNTIAWYENPQIESGLSDSTTGFGFTRRVVSSSAVNASSVFAIDVDGDGDQDVLSASIGDDKIAWYENLGLATVDGETTLDFTEHVITTLADGARSVFATQLSNDSQVDVLSASISDDTLAWYKGSATTPLTFERMVISSEVKGARSVFAADLDGDEDDDVIVAAAADGLIYWFETVISGDTTTFTQHTVAAATSVDAVFAADLDKDEQIDVLSAASVPGSVSDADQVAWHKNDLGNAGMPWIDNIVAETSEGLNWLQLADIDGDGRDDVVAATTTNQVVWYRNETDMTPGATPVLNRQMLPAVPGMEIDDARSVFAADIDLDGDLDIVSASAGNDKIYWHVNSLIGPPNKGGAPANFSTIHVLASGVDAVESVVVALIDDDLYPDVISASPGDDSVSWFRNLCVSTDCGSTLTEEFERNLISSQDPDDGAFTTLGARSVFAADMNGDTFVDILAASTDDDKVTLFQNDSEGVRGQFDEIVLASGDLNEAVFSENGAFSVSATDVDGDGDMDALVASSGSGQVSWYEQGADADVAFTQRPINVIAPIAAFVTFHDIDGDGDDDVLATSLGDNRVLFHENEAENHDPATDSGDSLVFTRHFVNNDGINPRSIVALDIDNDGADGDANGNFDDQDLLVGFRFKSSRFEQVGELCVNFDVNGDEVMDGVELAYIGRAFGQVCNPAAIPADWVCSVDYNDDLIIDGLDLAILSDPQVWGQTTVITDGVADCSFTCQ